MKNKLKMTAVVSCCGHGAGRGGFRHRNGVAGVLTMGMTAPHTILLGKGEIDEMVRDNDGRLACAGRLLQFR